MTFATLCSCCVERYCYHIFSIYFKYVSSHCCYLYCGAGCCCCSRIIKSVVTGQAPVTLELRNTPGKNTNIPKVVCKAISYTVGLVSRKRPFSTKSGFLTQQSWAFSIQLFSTEFSDWGIQSKNLTFSTGSVSRKTQSKKFLHLFF